MINSTSNKVQNIRNTQSPVQLTFTGGVNPKGAYNAGTAYATGDSVSYNGSSYVARQATTGHLPTDTTYWQVLANIGNQGPMGETGAQGPPGAITISATAPSSPSTNDLWIDTNL